MGSVVTITISIAVPDGASVNVSSPTAPPSGAEPLEDAPWPASPEAPPSGGAAAGVCPVHHVPWRTVPAGVSQKTGKPYAAFQACPERGCNERPR